MSDFDVSARILSSAGALRLDLESPSQGLELVTVQEPEETYREVEATADRVPGSSLIASVEDVGTLVVTVRAFGPTWAACAGNWETARAAYKAEAVFFVETGIEGVTKRWEARRPVVVPAEIGSGDIAARWQTYQLRFRVQPNPTVSIA